MEVHFGEAFSTEKQEIRNILSASMDLEGACAVATKRIFNTTQHWFIISTEFGKSNKTMAPCMWRMV